MKQIERIKYFENILNEGEKLTSKLNLDIQEFLDFYEKYKELDKYYQSEERKLDVLADEKGELPKDLLTGVLGEDYAYDFLVRKKFRR